MGRPRIFDEDRAVEQAMRLFWRHGYDGTSLRDLGQELGLKPGSLYAAFGDKESLFHRALDRYCDGQTTGLLAAVSAAGPLLPRLRALLIGIAQANQAAQERAAAGEPGDPGGCLIVGTAMDRADDEQAMDRVRATLERIDQALESALLRARVAGEIPASTDAAAAAHFLTTVLQGVQVMSSADPWHPRLEAAIDVALGALHANRPA
ncbi:TetR/AcrR family transcriptional regulator [Actinoplanes sp. TBRC 11911]|uniref:TetR/AcrR family transcriptional regulator n=1 Tax=Actinoplanes sp. TBRC 11911 TaxID=2729386 RepID=UPI00145F0CC1|nr:TetR/AcrR family transcriptional regulator [Actinoplanes sp. TBRC 11911]NMO53926.1 TetR/AcrR family transcriptional regulator [Actinoplanes sp. TBRC 11911]